MRCSPTRMPVATSCMPIDIAHRKEECSKQRIIYKECLYCSSIKRTTDTQPKPAVPPNRSPRHHGKHSRTKTLIQGTHPTFTICTTTAPVLRCFTGATPYSSCIARPHCHLSPFIYNPTPSSFRVSLTTSQSWPRLTARASLRYNTPRPSPSHPHNYCGIHIARARPRGRLPQPHGNKTDNYTPHDAPSCADSQHAVLRVPSAINVLHSTPPDAVVGCLTEHRRHFQTPRY
jgi:hypothetical protein